MIAPAGGAEAPGRGPAGWVRAKLASSPVLRHSLTLMSGTVIAQAGSMLLSIPLRRIFTDADYGRIGVFSSIASLVVAIASLRFDMTMMLPESDTDARVLKRLATRSIIVMSALASLVAVLARPWVASHYDGDWVLADLLCLVGLSVFLLAEVNVLQYWYNRKSDYKRIAVNRAQQSVGSSAGQLAVGVVGLTNVVGLFLGMIAGQLYAWANLGLRAKELREPLPEDAPSIRSMAYRYRKMPLLNGPNAIVDAIRTNGITLLVGEASLRSLGQFNLAWTMLQVPMSLIQSAISQVFFQKLTTLRPGEMEPLVRWVAKRAFLAGIIPFALIYLVSPWIFPFVFGEQYVASGDFARALTPWLFMTIVTSPISTTFIVAERQQVMLAFACVYCAVPLSILALSPWPLLTTIYVLGGAMTSLLLINTGLAIRAARYFDRHPPADKAEALAAEAVEAEAERAIDEADE